MFSHKPSSDYETLWYALDGVEERLTTHGDVYLTLRSVGWTSKQVTEILIVVLTITLDRSVEVTALDDESYYVKLSDNGEA